MVCFLVFGCVHKLEDNWQTIEIGDYFFDFPNDYKLIKQQGYDSYVGIIKGDSITFNFDFGTTTGNLTSDSEEWIECFNKAQIDTVDDLYRVITVPVEPCRGVTGVSICKLEEFTKSNNGFLALGLTVRDLTERQKALALKIYKTGRHKK